MIQFGVMANCHPGPGADLPRIVSRLNPGDEVTLDIVRDGDTEQVQVTLGERPTEVERSTGEAP